VHEPQVGPDAPTKLDDRDLRRDALACIGQPLEQFQDPGTALMQTSPTQQRTPILITETMLDQVNAISAEVLDQYEADARKCGAKANAQAFYDQLMTARRDYWYGQLVSTTRSPWATPL
jgi:hypothetical protein